MMMTPAKKATPCERPRLNAVGQPEPKREQPVEPFQPGRPYGERQDGPGAAPRHRDRDDALPAGGSAATKGEVIKS